MSVVIVGGHDRMVRQYMDICKKFNCKSKVFTQLPGNFRSQIGQADLIILFTSTVSHIMATGAVQEAEKNNPGQNDGNDDNCQKSYGNPGFQPHASFYFHKTVSLLLA